MEKRASNSFIEGLNTDKHPLTSKNTELIDARNIDLLAVGEGYQFILQKREGNEEVTITEDSVKKSAGLSDGFVPLAVQEFNGIAYIISVNPNTGVGEIGTFPSPDYTRFKLETGTTPILPTPTIDKEHKVWDPTSASLEYAYEIYNTGSGVNETVSGLSGANTQLNNAYFNIRNKGIASNSFVISMDNNSSNIAIYVDGSLYTGTDIPLGHLSTRAVTFKVINPYITTDEEVITRTVTVTPTDGTELVPTTYTFNYHTTVVIKLTQNYDGGSGDIILSNNQYVSFTYSYGSNIRTGTFSYVLALVAPESSQWLDMGQLTGSTWSCTVLENTSGSMRYGACKLTATCAAPVKTIVTNFGIQQPA